MREKEYYELIYSISFKDGFEVNVEKWKFIFCYMMKWIDPAFTKKVALAVFNKFEMVNSGIFNHERNLDFRDVTDVDEWWENFVDDLGYCSDRPSLDRLFRVHWLFLQTYRKEMVKYRSDFWNQEAEMD